MKLADLEMLLQGQDVVPLVGGLNEEDVGIAFTQTDIFNPEYRTNICA